MALPPQPSHRNVAEASAGKSHPLLPPPELPLFRSRKRMDRKGLTGGGSLPAVPEESSLWGRRWSTVVTVQPAASHPCLSESLVVSPHLPTAQSPGGPAQPLPPRQGRVSQHSPRCACPWRTGLRTCALIRVSAAHRLLPKGFTGSAVGRCAEAPTVPSG